MPKYLINETKYLVSNINLWAETMGELKNSTIGKNNELG